MPFATAVVLATVLTGAAAAQDRGVSAKAATSASPRADAIPWQWHEEAGPAGRAFSVSVEGGASVDVARGRDGKVMGLRKYGASGGEIWAVQLLAPTARNVAFLVHDGTLYIALYTESATGAEIAAVDTKTGHLLFRTPLRAPAPPPHSKLRNRVQLRFVDPWVVAFGDESAGRYIEALDAKTGEIVSSHKLRR